MTITAVGPDGVEHEFPDGTDQTVIHSVLGKKYGWGSPSSSAPVPQASTPKPAPAAKPVANPQGAANKPDAIDDFLRFAIKGPVDRYRAADDIVRMTANGLTGGAADWLSSKASGTPLEQERAYSEEAAKRAGGAGTVAEIAGTIAGPGKIAEAGAKLLPRLPAVGALLSRPVSQSAAQGAGIGAIDAWGHDQPIGSGAALGAASGLGGDIAARSIAGTVKGAAGLLNPRPNVPTLAELQAQKNAAYKAAEAAGGTVNKDAVNRLMTDLVNIGHEHDFDQLLHPSSAAFYRAAEKRYADRDLDMSRIDTLRRVANRTWESKEPSDRELGNKIRNKIDEFTGSLNPATDYAAMIGGGDPALADAKFKEARRLAHQSMKAEDIEQALGKGDRRTMKTGVGGNEDNVIRQNIDKLINGNTSWTSDELKALNETVLGHAEGASKYSLRNNARMVGRLSPVGHSLTAMLEGVPALVAVANGEVHKALPFMAAGGVGLAAKSLADALTRRSAEKAGEIVRAGGSASSVAVPPNAVQRLAESKRDALAKILMSYGATAGQ
jgi:hypothetical protein